MSYVSGDSKPRRKIVMFLIGAFIVFASAYIAVDASSAFSLPYLEYFQYGALAGLIVQAIALFMMIVYDRRYLVSAISCIIAFLCVGTFVITTTLHAQGLIPSTLNGLPLETFSFIDTVAESIMMIFFIVATEALMEHSYHGVPKLEKLLIVVYIILTVLQALSFIAQVANFTITIEWLGIALAKIQSISSIIKLVGTIVFIICSLIYIKD